MAGSGRGAEGRKPPECGAVTLKGTLAGVYRLREGDYRIMYQVLRKDHVIMSP